MGKKTKTKAKKSLKDGVAAPAKVMKVRKSVLSKLQKGSLLASMKTAMQQQQQPARMTGSFKEWCEQLSSGSREVQLVAGTSIRDNIIKVMPHKLLEDVQFLMAAVIPALSSSCEEVRETTLSWLQMLHTKMKEYDSEALDAISSALANNLVAALTSQHKRKQKQLKKQLKQQKHPQTQPVVQKNQMQEPEAGQEQQQVQQPPQLEASDVMQMLLHTVPGVITPQINTIVTGLVSNLLSNMGKLGKLMTDALTDADAVCRYNKMLLTEVLQHQQEDLDRKQQQVHDQKLSLFKKQRLKQQQASTDNTKALAEKYGLLKKITLMLETFSWITTLIELSLQQQEEQFFSEDFTPACLVTLMVSEESLRHFSGICLAVHTTALHQLASLYCRLTDDAAAAEEVLQAWRGCCCRLLLLVELLTHLQQQCRYPPQGSWLQQLMSPVLEYLEKVKLWTSNSRQQQLDFALTVAAVSLNTDPHSYCCYELLLETTEQAEELSSYGHEIWRELLINTLEQLCCDPYTSYCSTTTETSNRIPYHRSIVRVYCPITDSCADDCDDSATSFNVHNDGFLTLEESPDQFYERMAKRRHTDVFDGFWKADALLDALLQCYKRQPTDCNLRRICLDVFVSPNDALLNSRSAGQWREQLLQELQNSEPVPECVLEAAFHFVQQHESFFFVTDLDTMHAITKNVLLNAPGWRNEKKELLLNNLYN